MRLPPPGSPGQALAASARYQPAGGYTTTMGFGLVNPDGAILTAGRLAQLTQTAGPGVSAAATTHFGSGPVPGPVDAVHHPAVELAALIMAAVAGLALALAAAVALRRARKASAAHLT